MLFWLLTVSFIIFYLSFIIFAMEPDIEESLGLLLFSIVFAVMCMTAFIGYLITGNEWGSLNNSFMGITLLLGLVLSICGEYILPLVVSGLIVGSDFAIRYLIGLCAKIFHSAESKAKPLPHAGAKVVAAHHHTIFSFFHLSNVIFDAFCVGVVIAFIAWLGSRADRYEGGTPPQTITGTTYTFDKSGSYSGFQTTSYNIPGTRGQYVGPGIPIPFIGLVAIVIVVVIIYCCFAL
jgi:hypothetical protein